MPGTIAPAGEVSNPNSAEGVETGVEGERAVVDDGRLQVGGAIIELQCSAGGDMDAVGSLRTGLQ